MTEQWQQILVYECMDDSCKRQVRQLVPGFCNCGHELTRLVYVPETALAVARADALREWFNELDTQAVVHWTLTDVNADDPKAMLYGIIEQAERWALDPAISQSAAALVADAEKRGYKAAREQAAMIVEDEDIPAYMPDAGTIDRDLAIAEKIRAMQPRPAEAGKENKV